MRSVFEDLGFTPDWTGPTEQPPAYVFHFGNLTLRAAQVTGQYLRPEFFMTGIARTPRSFGMIASSAPLEVESFEQGVAFIAAAIGPHFTPLRPTAWLDQGRAWSDHLPGRRELAAYRTRPCCHVERDWFRLAARRLAELAQDAAEGAVATFTFDGTVLTIRAGDLTLPMPAEGTAWAERYAVRLQHLKALPKRLMRPRITIDAWDRKLGLDRLRLPLHAGAEWPDERSREQRVEAPHADP
jgi:hypothetical protein